MVGSSDLVSIQHGESDDESKGIMVGPVTKEASSKRLST